MPLADLSRLMSRGPAEILGLNKGLIAEGYDGDVVLVELGEPYTVRREDFAGKSKNTPYDGLSLYGRVACTVKAGRRHLWDNGSNRINHTTGGRYAASRPFV